jgi:hypothetical protein
MYKLLKWFVKEPATLINPFAVPSADCADLQGP